MRRPSRCLVALVLGAFVGLVAAAVPTPARAARPTAWVGDPDSLSAAAAAHRPGRWSVDFGITNNFSVTSFRGASISLTRNSSVRSAWQAGLTYGLTTDDATVHRAVLTDTSAVSDPGQSNSQQQVSLAATLLRLQRLHPARRIAAYIGVGPDVVWGRTHEQTEYEPGPTFPGSVTNTYRHDLLVGIAGVVGVEAFVTRDLSLHADYGTTARYVMSQDRMRRQPIDPATGRPAGPIVETVIRNHGWQVSASSVRFGVSLYL